MFKTLEKSSAAKISGRIIDKRSENSDLKNIKSIQFCAEINVNNKNYSLNLVLVPGIFPNVKVLCNASTDAHEFIQDFPYTYDSAGLTWLPLGYAQDVAYEKLTTFSPLMREHYNFQVEVLNLLHKTALDSFLIYFKNHELGILILNQLDNHYWEVFYTGHTLTLKDGIESFYCDSLLGKFQCKEPDEIIKPIINSMEFDHLGTIQFPRSIEIHTYSPIQRKLHVHHSNIA
jgi:hypothetical protein